MYCMEGNRTLTTVRASRSFHLDVFMSSSFSASSSLPTMSMKTMGSAKRDSDSKSKILCIYACAYLLLLCHTDCDTV